jgi:branched-chain amino acid transport system substrate-binding protein
MISSLRRRCLLAGALGGAASLVSPRGVRAQSRPLRLGVLTDLSGPYRADTGRGSVVAAELAVEDGKREAPDLRAEVIAADFAAQPERGIAQARSWLEHDEVDVILDVPVSTVALAVARLVQDADKLALISGAASADLTGPDCGSNHAHWTYDTWSQAAGTGRALVADGGDSWFFITTDDAFGHKLEADTTEFVIAAGGQVLGHYVTPFPGTDFSAAVISAVASGAKVVGMANAGADSAACLRQAAEFGVTLAGNQRIAGLLLSLAVVHEVGLAIARGLVVTETFYWDLDDQSRALSARFASRLGGQKPSSVNAGVYSAALHYLRAVASLGADAARSGRTAMQRMKAMPVKDAALQGVLRVDGRMVHPMYLFQVKTPMEQRYPWDLYTLRRTIPPERAFRPLDQGGCPLVRI